MGSIKITYRFVFPDGRTREHLIEIAGDTGRLVAFQNVEPETWTRLEHRQCSHCPLKPETHPHCPVAENLASVASDFKNERSFEEVVVEVATAERTYRKDLRLQEGLFGLFGLIMATSECPFLEFLSPMARFHLPFSTLRETMVRSVSFYLLRQYFVAKQGGTPDFELKAFAKLYKDLEKVNLGMANRIRSITNADAEANSIAILDGFGKLLLHQLSTGLQELEQMFTVTN
jgi:hypothetical protein